jgi:predicted nucleic acid-binding protein
MSIDREVLERAGGLRPANLRSLDAIHLVAALSLGDELDDVVTYDSRMFAAATAQGLNAVSPA